MINASGVEFRRTCNRLLALAIVLAILGVTGVVALARAHGVGP